VKYDVLSGTSVGALNAAKLAEGGPALTELEAIWLGLQRSADLYLEHQWFQLLESTIKSLFRGPGAAAAAGRFIVSYAMNKMLGALASAFGIPGILYTIVTSLYPVVTGVVDLVRYYDAVKQALAAKSLNRTGFVGGLIP
jgi:predicted acylesterase/phospholipase RssA